MATCNVVSQSEKRADALRGSDGHFSDENSQVASGLPCSSSSERQSTFGTANGSHDAQLFDIYSD